MSAVRIAHISDLHLSPFHKRANIRNTKRLLEFVRGLNVDHIVLTGDIVANAEPADYALARMVLAAHGLLDASVLSVVVGNHDIFGGVHTPEEIFEFPRRCRGTDYERRIIEFRQHFRELFDHCSFACEDAPFPYVKRVKDLLLIGMNSVAEFSTVWNPVGSNGSVEDQQLDRLDRMLSSDRFRHGRKVALIHHHFNKVREKADGTMHGVWRAFEHQTTKLRGKKRLMKFFLKHGVTEVLHGHLHQSTDYERKGIRFFNAGGSILGPDSEVLQINVLQFSGSGISLRRHMISTPDHGRLGVLRRAQVGPPLKHIAA